MAVRSQRNAGTPALVRPMLLYILRRKCHVIGNRLAISHAPCVKSLELYVVILISIDHAQCIQIMNAKPFK